MRIPHFPTIEPWEYDGAKHDKIYGGGTNRWLQSGYMGHLLNFPTFGGPSEKEAQSGLGNHGEALVVEWKKDAAITSADAVQLVYSAYLPKTQYNVGRTLTLIDGETVMYVEEWVENLLAFGRPAHWVQHATFGPPFVEPGKNVLDASATRGEVRSPTSPNRMLARGSIDWPWGTSPEGRRVSLREMRDRPKSGIYYAMLMDPDRERNYFTMFHKDYNVLIGYLWHTKDFPWLGDWQENKGNGGFAVEPPGRRPRHGVRHDAFWRADGERRQRRQALRRPAVSLDRRPRKGDGPLRGLSRRDSRRLRRGARCRDESRQDRHHGARRRAARSCSTAAGSGEKP